MKVIFARNYGKYKKGEISVLSPNYALWLERQNLVMFYTRQLEEKMLTEKPLIEAERQKHMEELKNIADGINSTVVRIIKKIAESGQFYSSVREKDILEKLLEKDPTIQPFSCKMSAVIKEPGVYSAKVDLGCGVKTEIYISANSSEALAEEAESKFNVLKKSTMKV